MAAAALVGEGMGLASGEGTVVMAGAMDSLDSRARVCETCGGTGWQPVRLGGRVYRCGCSECFPRPAVREPTMLPDDDDRLPVTLVCLVVACVCLAGLVLLWPLLAPVLRGWLS